MKILQRTAALALLAALLAGGGLVWDYQRTIAQPLEVDRQGELIEVERGRAFRSVIAELERRELVEKPYWLRVWARLNPETTRIQASEYRIEAGDTIAALAQRMNQGRVVLYSFTLVDGWTFPQVMAAIEAHPVLESRLSGLSAEAVAERLELAWPHAEGAFYPDTYRFPRGTTDEAFLRRAHEALIERLEAEWASRAPDLPLADPYEALILASIVERETGVASERGRVAGVFVRRLQRGMRLQTDPTVRYGVSPEFDGRLRTRHLRTDTPYNTYTRHGFPPTPIAMAGGPAIHAALNPEEGSELYFVSRGDGSHQFSDTLQEHNRAVRRYILGETD